MLASVDLNGVPNMLSEIEAGEAACNRGIATRTSVGAYNNNGIRTAFSMVNMSWGSKQLRGVGFKV